MTIVNNKCTDFLGATDEVSWSFCVAAIKLITENQNIFPTNSKELTTNHLKGYVYNQSFGLTTREKYTGFEFIQDWDKHARDRIVAVLSDLETGAIPDTYVHYDEPAYEDDSINIKKFIKYYDLEGKTYTEVCDMYKGMLVERAKTFRNQPNVLYLSGGMDSEIVAAAFIEAGVRFVPVIFRYIDNEGKYRNDHDTVYAFEFCKQHGLVPVEETINIEEFLFSDEIIEIAKETRVISPQFCAHHKMIQNIEKRVEQEGMSFFDCNLKTDLGITIIVPQFKHLEEVATDIWTAPVFTRTMCDDIVAACEKHADLFMAQPGDTLPAAELIIDEHDPVLRYFVKNYFEKTVWRELYGVYGAYGKELSQWINRVTASADPASLFPWHHDQSMFTANIKLNDNYDGGLVEFNRQNYNNFEIPVGNAMIWPSQVTHPHRVTAVTQGTRYSYVMFTKCERGSSRKRQLESLN